MKYSVDHYGKPRFGCNWKNHQEGKTFFIRLPFEESIPLEVQDSYLSRKLCSNCGNQCTMLYLCSSFEQGKD